VPAGAITQSAGETGDEIVVHWRVRLEVYSLDLEGSLLAVGLGVEPANEGAGVQYREGVVSVPAAGSRGVDLDLILEVEELESTRPIPDHRIERG
jgi:predicted secreted hydrolase